MAAADRGIAVLLLLAACSGDDGGAPPGAEPVPLSDLCPELAEADCARLSACEALYAPFDEATCRTRQRVVLCGPRAAALARDVSAGSVAYFELAARDCVDAVRNLDCDIGFDHDPFALDACGGMVEPTAADGDACSVPDACTDGMFCDASGGCPGACTPFIQNNEPCRPGERCAPDLYCDLSAMRCLERSDIGSTCANSVSGNACVDGAYCDRSQPGSEVCARGRGRNQGCNSAFECAAGARCVSNLCSAGLEGDTCTPQAPCQLPFRCVGGRCRAPLPLDETCEAAGPPCAPGLTCTSTAGGDRCRPRPVPGEPCDGSLPCYLSRCDAGRCVASTPDGESCGTMDDCHQGRSCATGQCTPPAVACGS